MVIKSFEKLTLSLFFKNKELKNFSIFFLFLFISKSKEIEYPLPEKFKYFPFSLYFLKTIKGENILFFLKKNDISPKILINIFFGIINWISKGK